MGLFDAKPGGTIFGNIFRSAVSVVTKGAVQLQPKIPAPGQPVEAFNTFAAPGGGTSTASPLFGIGKKEEPTFMEKIEPYIPIMGLGIGLLMLFKRR